MIKFFSIFLLFQEIFLYFLIKGANKNKSKYEQFLEDNIQMEFLKNYKNKLL